MVTKVELYRDGHREVFHRTDGGTRRWTHTLEAPCEVCHPEPEAHPRARRVARRRVLERTHR